MKPEQGFILIVDDNEANRDVLSRRLKKQGHSIAVAENGRQALDMLRTQPFDLILLDVMMPEMNGYQVLEELKHHGSLRHIPVIMISALDDIDSVVRCIELGAEDYLYKPFNPVLLKARVSASLEKKWLRDQEQAYLQAVKRELELGRRIQADFLPGALPRLPGWEIDAVFQPAREVAGDFYDVFVLPGDTIGLVIADVCDKGVGAALFMALCRSLIRSFAEQVTTDATDALDAVRMTNNYIARHHHNHRSRMHMFATLFFGVLNPSTGVLSYINAGHEPPVLLGASGVKQLLEPTGPAVGFMAESVFERTQTSIEPGEMVFAYTDGITEARGPKGDFFGEELLMDLLNRPASSAAALMERVQEQVGRHIADSTPSDDITMLAVRRRPQ
ncbi:MAG: PP2C family protein-serine/threonine phosphatase [Chloroflexaceae bacterium]|nr:PP2C family protein-serine/threonine phosphatase [Chloroflexaceae bacterium]